jgi:hypothetical protein
MDVTALLEANLRFPLVIGMPPSGQIRLALAIWMDLDAKLTPDD